VPDMSRQAAQQRYGGEDSSLPRTGGKTLRLAPLTSVTEMRILERAGRYGWHSIGFGTLLRIVEKSDLQWEHRRVRVGEDRHELEAAGWDMAVDGSIGNPNVPSRRCQRRGSRRGQSLTRPRT
jgi:hypothetical protein